MQNFWKLNHKYTSIRIVSSTTLFSKAWCLFPMIMYIIVLKNVFLLDDTLMLNGVCLMISNRCKFLRQMATLICTIFITFDDND